MVSVKPTGNSYGSGWNDSALSGYGRPQVPGYRAADCSH